MNEALINELTEAKRTIVLKQMRDNYIPVGKNFQSVDTLAQNYYLRLSRAVLESQL